MRVIVQHEEEMGSYLAQYATCIEPVYLNYKIVDTAEKYLPWLSEMTQYIEVNFKIELHKEKHMSELSLNNNEMILATIGSKDTHNRIDAYYNMKTHTLEPTDRVIDVATYQWINCYSENDEINAEEYIRCICYLRTLSSECQKPIIIYANIYVPDETYRYRGLTYKIISNYLVDINGVLITKTVKDEIWKHYTPTQKPYEFYLDHTIYLEDSLNDTVKKVIPLLYTSRNQARFKNIYKHYRQDNSLYRNNVFYQAISPEQEIYVALTLGEFRSREDYQALGIQHIPLIGDYGMLYAKRSVFDEFAEILRLEVAHPYYIPVLSYPYCDKNTIVPNFHHEMIREKLTYKGKGVYIGVIATDYVDYTNQALRTRDGESRISYIWEQVRANTGIHFLREQINEALRSPNPEQIIKLPEDDSISTMILGIAGGESELPHYRGIATEAEFIVAKVNTAPEAFQRIYGGMPSKNATTMADMLIAVLELINFSRREGRPLVLCIPFNTNIDPHDGSLVLHEILGLIAAIERVTIIVPTGEEADKMHHYSIGGQQPLFTTVDINVQKENQNIVGIAYQKFSTITSVSLYPPEAVMGEFVNLKRLGITRMQGAVIYSNGYKTSPLNGAIRMLFRIEGPRVGTWKILFELDTELSSQMDMWISQQELNEYITLNPSSPFITIGSLASINNVMSVGGYDKDNMVVLRSSGRGYTWDNRIKPLFITHASHITAPCGRGEWVQVTGTLAAASIMAGVAATIYDKCIQEQVFPFPNTLVMRSIILGMITQFEDIEYPNPSQGYGILDIQELNHLLTAPFIL